MKAALLQLNFIVGDFDYNYQKFVNGWDADTIIQKGFDAKMVTWVINRIYFNE